MILIVSVFVTNQRPDHQNRYPRIDIFKYMLYSYSKIEFTDCYFFIQLDDEFMKEKEELNKYITQLFKKNTILFERYTKQVEWVPFIQQLSNNYPSELVWLAQNDDHIFIDSDTSILKEGINLLSNDTSEHKSLVYSHWTEHLKLSGKHSKPELIQKYVKFKLTMIDSVHIFSMKYIYYLFITHEWKKDNIRIDSIINEVTQHPNEDNPLLQTIYVPLKELCRKFNAYDHVYMSHTDCPPLQLPFNTFNYDKDSLKNKMTANHYSHNTINNNFEIPQEWIEINYKLHTIETYTL